MSEFIQHPAASIKLSFAARRAAWLLSLTVLLVVAAAAVVLLVSNGSSNSSASTPVSTNTSSPISRYDGGPEEGTAGPQQLQLHRGVIAGPRPFHGGGFNDRYNGGPQE